MKWKAGEATWVLTGLAPTFARGKTLTAAGKTHPAKISAASGATREEQTGISDSLEPERAALATANA